MKTLVCHRLDPGIGLLLERLEVPHDTAPPANPGDTALIQWGRMQEPPDAAYVLNRAAMTERAFRPDESRRLLELNGIAAEAPAARDHPQPGYIHDFAVPVFHLKPLSVFERKRSAVFAGAAVPRKQPVYEELDFSRRSSHANRAMREAVRAVYALGLDFGMVRIRIHADGKPAVASVNPVPRLNARLAGLFAAAIRRFGEEWQDDAYRMRKVVLGADPEFLLRDASGAVLFADRFLEKEGPAGCDSIVLQDRSKIYPLAEVRPKPAGSPAGLVRNLRRALIAAAGKIGGSASAWLAGGMPEPGYPLGGHIHFSGVWLNSHLLRVLDNYLALPLVLMEDSTTRSRRPRYGFLGDFRRQPHGGFEYRTLPSWLFSPGFAYRVLTLAAFLAGHYRELHWLPLHDSVNQKAYYAGDKLALLPVAARLWSEMEKLPAYASVRRTLEPFKTDCLRLAGWNEQADFRGAWGLSAAVKT
jgi:hypothetical protein